MGFLNDMDVAGLVSLAVAVPDGGSAMPKEEAFQAAGDAFSAMLPDVLPPPSTANGGLPGQAGQLNVSLAVQPFMAGPMIAEEFVTSSGIPGPATDETQTQPSKLPASALTGSAFSAANSISASSGDQNSSDEIPPEALLEVQPEALRQQQAAQLGRAASKREPVKPKVLAQAELARVPEGEADRDVIFAAKESDESEGSQGAGPGRSIEEDTVEPQSTEVSTTESTSQTLAMPIMRAPEHLRIASKSIAGTAKDETSVAPNGKINDGSFIVGTEAAVGGKAIDGAASSELQEPESADSPHKATTVPANQSAVGGESGAAFDALLSQDGVSIGQERSTFVVDAARPISHPHSIQDTSPLASQAMPTGTPGYYNSATLQAQRPLGQPLAVAIGKTVQDGRDHLRISLEPKDLGQLDVRLSIERNGSLRAVVTASSEASAELLRQDMPTLVRSLADAGLKVDGGSIRLEVQADARGNSQHRRQHEEQEPRTGRNNADSQFIEEEFYAMRPIRAGSQIELRA